MASYSASYACECGTQLIVQYSYDRSPPSYQTPLSYSQVGFCPACIRRYVISHGSASSHAGHLPPGLSAAHLPTQSLYSYGPLYQGYPDGYYGVQRRTHGQATEQPFYRQAVPQGSGNYTYQLGTTPNAHDFRNTNADYHAASATRIQQPQTQTQASDNTSPSDTNSWYRQPIPGAFPSSFDEVTGPQPTTNPRVQRSPSPYKPRTSTPTPATGRVSPKQESCATASGSQDIHDPEFWVESRHKTKSKRVDSITISSSSSSSSGSDSSRSSHTLAENTPSGSASSSDTRKYRHPSVEDADDGADDDGETPIAVTSEGEILLLGDQWIVPSRERAIIEAGSNVGFSDICTSHDTLNEDGDRVRAEILERGCFGELTMSGGLS